MSNARSCDVIILGAGAAGLMAAKTAGARGRRVVVLEVANKPGKKILMSGGGRCNFTNLEVLPSHFICRNPHFVKSALKQYTNWDFIGMVAEHGIAYHEKEAGQLFCDKSSKQILAMLLQECELPNIDIFLETATSKIESNVAGGFNVTTETGVFECQSLVIATGGLSIPTLGGATGLGYDLAREFGIEVYPLSASLVPFTLSGVWKELSASLAGVSLTVDVQTPSNSFYGDMLFTHRGLSGPAILQSSNYWELGQPIIIDLIPNISLEKELLTLKQKGIKKSPLQVIAEQTARSVADKMIDYWWPQEGKKSVLELSNKTIEQIHNTFHQWSLTPSGTEGYRTAEVTKAGVSVDEISSQTMEHKHVKNLFFVGEVLDVTGHLGGFNFQWAWSSGYVAGKNA